MIAFRYLRVTINVAQLNINYLILLNNIYTTNFLFFEIS